MGQELVSQRLNCSVSLLSTTNQIYKFLAGRDHNTDIFIPSVINKHSICQQGVMPRWTGTDEFNSDEDYIISTTVGKHPLQEIE